MPAGQGARRGIDPYPLSPDPVAMRSSCGVGGVRAEPSPPVNMWNNRDHGTTFGSAVVPVVVAHPMSGYAPARADTGPAA